MVVRRIEPRAMDLLCYFAAHPGEVLGREQIIESVWPHTFITDSALQTAVSMLRKAFDDDPRSPRVIETISKRGYRLIASSSAAIPVVAVLPFENLTGSADQQFLADGITDTLISELGRFESLRVISRQSIMAFKDSKLVLPEIARQLNATVVVEGSVLPHENGISVSVQLIDAVSDSHLWSDTYRSELDEVFRRQQSAARRIVEQMNGKKNDGIPGVASDVHPEAFVDYLRGRYHWYQLSPERFSIALRYFEAAIRKDPGFAAAHAGIADACAASAYWGARPATSVRAAVQSAIANAEAADPYRAETQMLAAAYRFYAERDWAGARARIEQAIRLNPNLAHARMQHALFLATWKDDGAIDEVEFAVRLDPLNAVVHLARGYCLAGAERFDEARECLAQALELNPALSPGWEMRADLAWIAGDDRAREYELLAWEADAEVRTVLESGPSNTPERLTEAARLIGARVGTVYVMPLKVARLHSLAGRFEEATQILSRAIDDEDLLQIDLLSLMPSFRDLRADPVFRTRVMRRLGLP
jgi:TolB-like protein/Tfp pilus assembly protein PilF